MKKVINSRKAAKVILAAASAAMLFATSCSSGSDSDSDYTPPVEKPGTPSSGSGASGNTDGSDQDDVLPEATKGAINLFNSSAESFSGDAEVAESLTGVSVKYKSVEWCDFAGKGAPVLAEGYPAVKQFANAAFTVGGVATGSKDSNNADTYGITGAYFSAGKIDVGGTSSSKVTIASSGTTVVKVLFDVTAGNTPLTLKTVSLKAGQSQTANAELYVADVKVSSGKDLTVKNAAVNKTIASGATETIAIEVKLTSDWKSNGEKAMDFVIGDLAFDAEAAAETFKCSVCSKEWSTQAKADKCGNTENCPGYVPGVTGGSSSQFGGTPSGNKTDNKPEVTVTGATETVQILDSNGALESAWVKFAPVVGATSYEVYANDVKLDKELIRGYSTTAGGTSVEYYRADAVGLKAGSYTLKVVAVKDGGNLDASTGALDVKAHERIGFAFHDGYVPGAYKMDGTLKDGAVVVYVNNSNFNSVVVTTKDAKGNTITFTGLQELLDTSGWWKYSSKPLVIRVLGKVDATTGFPSSSWGSSEEGLQVKCNKTNQDMNFTIEGIGDDAVFHGFGVLCRQTKGVELRNFAEMAFADDGISLDTDNYNTWVHNLDIFYGATGGDADQAKGDGSLDVKGDSMYQTYSYVHFWDSGKMSLCGMKSETGPNYITYHHNWFDHSDSRHPRVRTMTVHVFNNYYDGNAKYGAGATTGADLFVENNYFRNVKFPMMSSLQGNDVYAGSSTYKPSDYGTFSGETSGSIKSYGNKIIDTNKTTSYWPYGAATLLTKGEMVSAASLGIDTTKHFDCFEVTNRNDTVPAAVTGYSGGDTYNNFDTDSKFYVANLTPDTPDVAKDKVTMYAGRVNGGDFSWTFKESDDTYDKVDAALKSAVVGYKSKLVTTNVDGSVAGGNGGDTGNGGDDNGGSTDPIAVTGVTLNKTTTSITVGESETLTVTVAPANATTKTVTWTSNNTDVATVSTSGKVTAKAEGKATITVTTTEGSFTATCEVTVKAAPSSDNLDVTYPTKALAVGTYKDATVMFTEGTLVTDGLKTAVKATQVDIYGGEYVSFMLAEKSDITLTVGNKAVNIVSDTGASKSVATGTQTVTLDAGKYYIVTSVATSYSRLKTANSILFTVAASAN